MPLVNCTPHDVMIYRRSDDHDLVTTIKASGMAPRVRMVALSRSSMHGIEVVTEEPAGVDYLPERSDGVLYIVSAMVLEASGRQDLVAPGPPVRDADGRIVGCLGLVSRPRRYSAQEVHAVRAWSLLEGTRNGYQNGQSPWVADGETDEGRALTHTLPPSPSRRR